MISITKSLGAVICTSLMEISPGFIRSVGDNYEVKTQNAADKEIAHQLSEPTFKDRMIAKFKRSTPDREHNTKLRELRTNTQNLFRKERNVRKLSKIAEHPIGSRTQLLDAYKRSKNTGPSGWRSLS